MNDPGSKREWLDRKQILTLLMIAATLVGFYLCYLVAKPFLASLVWAVALAVLVFPLYKRVLKYVGRPDIAAAILTCAVALVIVAPVVITTRQVAREVWASIDHAREKLDSGEWRAQIESNEYGAGVLRFIERDVDVRAALEQAANAAPAFVSGFVSGTVWFVVQLLITFFALFFFLRDHQMFLRGASGLIPLDKSETSTVFKRVSDTLHAAVFGEILISAIQGTLGGLLFWVLGLPAPFLWGLVIAIFGFLPAIGGWMVWAPVVVYLILQDQVTSGIILLVGGIATMIFTTMLYPKLVGDRLRMHTLNTLIAIVGGIMAFGMVGIILGPMILALTTSLIHFWRRRLDNDEARANGHIA